MTNLTSRPPVHLLLKIYQAQFIQLNILRFAKFFQSAHVDRNLAKKLNEVFRANSQP
jgi:hypothetical protein